jgi:hypothetical protein
LLYIQLRVQASCGWNRNGYARAVTLVATSDPRRKMHCGKLVDRRSVLLSRVDLAQESSQQLAAASRMPSLRHACRIDATAMCHDHLQAMHLPCSTLVDEPQDVVSRASNISYVAVASGQVRSWTSSASHFIPALAAAVSHVQPFTMAVELPSVMWSNILERLPLGMCMRVASCCRATHSAVQVRSRLPSCRNLLPASPAALPLRTATSCRASACSLSLYACRVDPEIVVLVPAETDKVPAAQCEQGSTRGGVNACRSTSTAENSSCPLTFHAVSFAPLPCSKPWLA